MSILNFDSSRGPRSGKSLKLALGAGAIAAIVALASTLAAGININSGPVEFGQGVSETAACDSDITITPYSDFDNSYGPDGDFLFSGFTISELDSTEGGCAGKGFTIKAYGETSSAVLATYSFMNNGTSFSSDYGMMAWDNEGTENSSVDLYFASPNVLASAVYKITVESSDTLSVMNAAFMRLATGYQHTCFTMVDTTVRCWGYGGSGQLGNGLTENSSVPVVVTGLSGVTQLSSGREFTCALLSSGGVKCWGSNNDGRLGNDSFSNSSIPVSVDGITNAIGVITGGAHACALLQGGSIKCWGDNEYGQLGNADDGSSSSVPVSVVGIDNASQIAAGDESTCALIAGGAVKCWGTNYDGQLGNDPNDFNYSNTPVFVKYENGTNLSEAIQLTGSKTWEHYCVRYTSGIADCWGSNGSGQLGIGTQVNSSSPVQVSEITDFAFIAAGWANSCGQRVNREVYCWGDNEWGQIGDGTFDSKSTPGGQLNLSGVTQIDPGDLHTCALITGNTVYCWGNNEDGELGDGTTTGRSTPVLVNW
jgi:alpha-tubulin suppressor-like RCC1 family protein